MARAATPHLYCVEQKTSALSHRLHVLSHRAIALLRLLQLRITLCQQRRQFHKGRPTRWIIVKAPFHDGAQQRRHGRWWYQPKAIVRNASCDRHSRHVSERKRKRTQFPDNDAEAPHVRFLRVRIPPQHLRRSPLASSNCCHRGCGLLASTKPKVTHFDSTCPSVDEQVRAFQVSVDHGRCP